MATINELSLEIKMVLRKQPYFQNTIKEKVAKLEKLIRDTEWCSRYIDDIDLPTELLMHYGYYQEALKLLIAATDCEPCSLDLPSYHLDMAICYFNLKDYQKAEKYFDMVASDDEDYCEYIYPYRQKLEELKK